MRSKARRAIREARRRYEADPDRYFYPDQYNNPFNWRAHYETTAPEILEQVGGRLTHFVAGLGTSGTFVGVARRLREVAPHVILASVQPDSPLHGIEGLKHMETAIVPGIYDPGLAHRTWGGHRGAHHDPAPGREEGFSSASRRGQPRPGAAAAHRRRDQIAPSEPSVPPRSAAGCRHVFPDGGERYLSKPDEADDGITLWRGADAIAHTGETYLTVLRRADRP
jgi:hypothetical protein